MVANSAWNRRSNATPWLLAPCDLQAIKASGVTFVSSMLERVIEEQARGDPAKAESITSIVAVIGNDLAQEPPMGFVSFVSLVSIVSIVSVVSLC